MPDRMGRRFRLVVNEQGSYRGDSAASREQFVLGSDKLLHHVSIGNAVLI